jgi:hypothetical protein
MKRNFLFAVALSLLAVAGVSAQKAANFSGHWELDPAKSKIEGRRIDAMTLDVTQTAKDIKVDTKTTRAPRPDANTPNPTGAPGGMGRGFGGDTSVTYTLDGTETTIQQEGPNGPLPVKLTGKLDAGKLNLATTRTFNGPNGEISISSKDSWTLSPDGKTLTVNREQSSPRGNSTMELVFVKK